MKATLSFNLDDRDDSIAHFRCVKALDLALTIWTFQNELSKIRDTSEDGKWLDGDLVFRAWTDALEEHTINLNELVI